MKEDEAVKRAKKNEQQVMAQAQRYKNAIFREACGYFEINLTQNKFISPVYEITDGVAKDITQNVPKEALNDFDSMGRYAVKNVKLSNTDEYAQVMSAAYLLDCYKRGQTTPEMTSQIVSPLGIERWIRRVFYLDKNEASGDIIAECVLYDVTEQVQQKRQLKRDLEIIKGVAKEYISIYYIGLETETFVICNLGKEVTDYTRALLSREKNAYKVFRKWVEYSVDDEYKDKVLKLTGREGIIEALDGRTKYTMRFKNNGKGFVEWEEIVFIKTCAPNETPKNVLLGFRDVSKEVNESMDREAELLVQKQKLEELNREYKKRNEELEAFQRLNGANIWELNFEKNGKIDNVRWSDNVRQAFGYESEDDFPNTMESWLSCIEPADLERVKKEFYDAVGDKTGATKFDTEYRIKLKSGEMHWFRAAAEIYRSPDGSPKYVLGTVNDINAKKMNDNLMAVISTLSADYECVTYVRITEVNKKDSVSILRTSPVLLKLIPEWRTERNFHMRLQLLYERAVVEEDKADFYAKTRREVIFDKLSKASFYLVRFSILHDGKVAITH